MPVHSYSYSVPYIIVAIIAITLAILAQYTKNKKIFLFCLSCILIYFLGFRGYVLTDFLNYATYFNRLPTITNLTPDDLLRFEPLFVLYSSLIKTLVNNYFVWVILNTIVDIIVLNYIFKKYSISIFLSWFFFIVYMGILMEFNLFRNMKAIDLFLLSLPYIQKRNFFKFFIINLIGIFFHISAILYIPTYFFIYKKISKKIIIFLFIVTNIIFLLQIFPTSYIFDIIGNINPTFKALKYVAGQGEGYGISMGYIERTLVYILCLRYYDKLFKIRETNVVFCNSFFIYYLLFHTFADVPAFTSRLPLLFIYSYWIIIPNLMGLIKSTYKSSWYALILIFGIFKMLIGYSTITYKYDNIIFGIESFAEREINVYREWYE